MSQAKIPNKDKSYKYPTKTKSYKYPTKTIQTKNRFIYKAGGIHPQLHQGLQEFMGGGTEAFSDLGEHCSHPDCRQLDFLPFTCDGCHSSYCLDHRSYEAHNCPKPGHENRRVVVCEACSDSFMVTGKDEGAALERHEKSGECDPSKRKKPICPVRRCRQVLTFSNTITCKTCRVKVCLEHRFPTDHSCKGRPAANPAAGVENSRWNEKFIASLDIRSGAKDCGKEKEKKGHISPKSSPSIKAY